MHDYREEELARLVLILITPDPITGAYSTSASANQHIYFRELAKDTLICALDALAQFSDACSPLKSLTGGLMFMANWADVSELCALYFARTDKTVEVGVKQQGGYSRRLRAHQ